MKMICDVPNEVIESVRMGTWCGSSVAEKMIANGIPLDKIRAEIKAASLGKWYVGRIDGKAEEVLLMADVLQILDKYKAESEGKE